VPEEVAIPRAAQRWLDRALPRETAIPSRVAVGQQGEMEANGRWLPFKATATYRAAPLAYEWRARLSIMPGIWVIATDGHADGNGWGGAKLWGLRSMGQRNGPEVLVTQLIRHLAELAWLPDLALADPALDQADTSEDTFEISADAAGRRVTVSFDVTADGDIVRASSPSRPYDVPDGYEEAPWHCEFGDHRDFDGLRRPSTVVATYEPAEGPWEYFHGRITEVSRSDGTS
jgi:hypothetical protein